LQSAKVTDSREREVDDVGGKGKKGNRSRYIWEKPSLDRFGLVIAACIWKTSHDAEAAFHSRSTLKQ
jgi:hypothetical protein